jgi:hypothetical protein
VSAGFPQSKIQNLKSKIELGVAAVSVDGVVLADEHEARTNFNPKSEIRNPKSQIEVALPLDVWKSSAFPSTR